MTKLCWVCTHSPSSVCQCHFLEQAAVEFDVDVPMLHSVGYTRGLENMLQHKNGCSEIIVEGPHYCLFIKCLGPPQLSDIIQLAIEDICRKYDIYDHLAKPHEFSPMMTVFSFLHLRKKKEKVSCVVLAMGQWTHGAGVAERVRSCRCYYYNIMIFTVGYYSTCTSYYYY